MSTKLDDYPFHALAADLEAANAIPAYQPQLDRLTDQSTRVRTLEARRDSQAATLAGTKAELDGALVKLERGISEAQQAGAKFDAILECGVTRIRAFRALGRHAEPTEDLAS